MEKIKSAFNTLNSIDVNAKTEKKSGLTYLSWAYAWAEVKKLYPNASYEIQRNIDGMPFVCDPSLGYMVSTVVTIDDVSHEMWLPVMDGANKAMKSESYEYATKYGNKTVEAATMFDINKTLMRCLTKNLAMHGLGLYIYAGEDLPEEQTTANTITQTITPTSPTLSILPLVKGDANWDNVEKYVKANKSIGEDKILQQIGRKYDITDAVKKEIAKIIKSK
jgi:hypothetical protein